MAEHETESPETYRSAAIVLTAVAGAVLATRALLRARRAFELRGKTVLVTGGSRGLGLVLAREFAAEGARVAICARDADELERARVDLERRGAAVLAIPCDVTDRDQVEGLVDSIDAAWGPVDVLVNNAGIIQVGPPETMTTEDYENAMRTHFWGPLYTMLAVIPAMRRRRSGRIVNISSFGGKISVPHLLPYSASKFALTGLSEGFRGALARDGIYVTTVCPGLMRTGSPRNAMFKGRHREEYAWFSIGDALPLITISATRAARRIIGACRYGDAELTMPLIATAAVAVHGLAPGLVSEIVTAVEGMLPGPGGVGEKNVRGYESESRLSPSVLTTLGDRAAARNNELG